VGGSKGESGVRERTQEAEGGEARKEGVNVELGEKPGWVEEKNGNPC